MRSLMIIGAAFVAAIPLSAFASPVCPALTGASGSYQTAPTSIGDNCNTVITANPDGSLSFAFPNMNLYDGSEDNYVGFINNRGVAITSLNLSGTTDLFGFDGDGIDAYGLQATHWTQQGAAVRMRISPISPTQRMPERSTFSQRLGMRRLVSSLWKRLLLLRAR